MISRSKHSGPSRIDVNYHQKVKELVWQKKNKAGNRKIRKQEM